MCCEHDARGSEPDLVVAGRTAAVVAGKRSAEVVAQRVSRLGVEIAAGSTGSLVVPLVVDWGLGLEWTEFVSVTSKSAAVAKGCVFEDRSKNQVQRCDGGRSKVVHLFPTLERDCHYGSWIQGPGPTLSLSSLALVVAAAVMLDRWNEALASQSEETDQY
jgi:hypothetical protein